MATDPGPSTLPARGRRVVLVGGGHAHVEILRRWAQQPPPGAGLTIVVDRDRSIYSGMVPGFVAGQYAVSDLEIDVRELARRAGAELVLAPAVRIDAPARVVQVKEKVPVPYDVASLDVGSTVAGTQLPGVREHAIPARPIQDLVERVQELVRLTRLESEIRLVVVGAGAGGIELAFCFEARSRREGVCRANVSLLDASPEPLVDAPRGLVVRVEQTARRRGIAWRRGAQVAGVERGGVFLKSGEWIPADAVVWVAGPAAHPLLRESKLPVDMGGFVRIDPTLRVEGHADLFAVGDCASFSRRPVPKAGVYAVRAGPVLWRNLNALLRGGRLSRYRPQRGFLSLLNLGDGTAIGTKWGVSFQGEWVMRLKDRIDRGFMERYA